ncbi:hypothetical protein D3C77_180490 [compost metagenome]
MQTTNKLRWPTEDSVSLTSREFFSVRATTSYCYAKGGTYRFESKIILKDGSIEIKNQEQKTPDLYITKEIDATLFSQYGASNKDGEILVSSLPGWFNHRHDSDYQTHYLKTFYSIQKSEAGYHIALNSAPEERFPHPAVLLGTPTDDAFSHFIFETFAKLSALSPEVIATYYFIVSDHIKAYQESLLEAAGISKVRQIKRSTLGKGNVFFKELIIVKWPSHNNIWTAPATLNFLKDFFSSNFSSTRHLYSNLNYLDRDDERRAYRPIENEAELKSEALRKGFDIQTLGALNFTQKFALFQQSEGVIGQYGGGLQMCFLSKHQSKIIVIQSELFIRTHIDFMASILGFETLNLIAEASTHEKHSNAPIKVNSRNLLIGLNKFQF